MRPTRCRPPQEQAPSAAYALPPPQEPPPSRASLPALGLSGPPVPRTVPRRPRLRFRPLRLTGPGLHRGQAERPLPADCISQRALRRRAASGRAERPQSTLGNVVRNPTPPPPPPLRWRKPSVGLTGVSRSRCGLLAAVLLQARGVRKGQRLREKLEEGEWASAAVRRLTPARRASAHPDMAAECSGRSERLREI